MKIHLLLVAICLSISAVAQPALNWQKTYGGSGPDVFEDILALKDGSYIVVATTASRDGDLAGKIYFDRDPWLLRLDSTGKIVWQTLLGGSGMDQNFSLAQAENGGYLICGQTNSTDVPGNHGIQNDAYTIKTDSTGKVLWHKAWGGNGADYGKDICVASDGSGYYFTGMVGSNDGDVTGNRGAQDIWVVKLSRAGGLIWQKCFGGSSSEWGKSIIPTPDGGCVIAGSSYSQDGNLTKNNGDSDIWAIKVSSTGTLVWQRSFGGSYDDDANEIIATKDGEFLIVGSNHKSGGDVTGNKGLSDAWILKLRANGTLAWQRSYGGSNNDTAMSVVELPAGGYIVVGKTYSNDSDITNLHGTEADLWVMQLDADGKLKWSKTFGGTGYDDGIKVTLSKDGKPVIVGAASIADGDLSGNNMRGGLDGWIIKLDQLTSVEAIKERTNIKVYPTVTNRDIYITLPASKQAEILEMTDMNGRLINTSVSNVASRVVVTPTGISSGTYILSFIYEGEKYSYKIIYQ